ncbi:DUF1398 family protein [Epilithonimonas ginsengisoli]|uniref:DUF1398 family protein n=1 Tax=Epilithonimonas ginsengisoli TaxID=1245592 RepID=A0ABU4JCV1_9FLAO|nr:MULTISPECIES: DUF1398 family protein [Chryseobacterium group]MBV6878254.1 DUF1398 domain-containing protein [Epilithonimonas sp. FP105]MDW8547505.1 DUF1398 family protein [Epilithonimonas ginsengisoli]OAH68908.1 hypothetical protein AXA65_15835 [Chryseobacterium sp. FP211-J200]
MFTLAQIEAAYSNIETGKDFPEFAKTVKELGVSSFETYVEDGSSTYKGNDDEQVTSAQRYAALLIYGIVNPEKFLSDLRNHQQGNTDFFQFCKDCADSGVFKWVVDLKAKTCTYYDCEGAAIYEEKIPS